MKYFKILLFIVFAFASLFAGCERMARLSRPIQLTTKGLWAGSDLRGLTLDLKDRVNIRIFSFADKGLVAVTLGKRNGSIAAPVYQWKINGEWLEILDMDTKVIYRMRPLIVNAYEVVVDNGLGQKETYKISKR